MTTILGYDASLQPSLKIVFDDTSLASCKTTNGERQR
jgi:hypothetical protein